MSEALKYLKKYFFTHPKVVDYGERRIIMIVLGVVSLSVIILAVLGINRPWMIGLLATLVVSHALTLRGSHRTASMLTTISGMIVVTSLIYINGGIRDTAMLGLIVVIIAASLMNGRLGLLVFGLFSLIVVNLLGVGEWQGWFVTKFSRFNYLADYLVANLVILMVIALQWAVISRLNENTRKARAELAERKQTEKALVESEARYRFVVQEAPLGIIIIDPKGAIEQVNPSAQFLLGFSQQELVGTDPAMLFDDEKDDVRALKAGQTIRIERILVRKNKAKITVIGGTKQMPDGRYLYIFQDITNRKQMEDATQRLNEQLDQRVQERTAELEASNRELEAFSYTVSHDLRAPLRGIVGFSKMLLSDFSDELAPEARAMLHRINENGKQMGALVDDLLAFSRLGRQPLKKYTLTPEQITQMVNDVIAEVAAGTDRTIDWQVGKLAGCEADPTLLKQVWVNLISNAYKFTRGVNPARIEIDMTPGLAYYVRDNGTGFDMKYASKLFGVFQRLHHASEFEGTGVGLAIVQRIIQKHGGVIWTEAQPGLGAAFYFTLPETSEKEKE
jgi:PAS domain S-box-containing protein